MLESFTKTCSHLPVLVPDGPSMKLVHMGRQMFQITFHRNIEPTLLAIKFIGKICGVSK
jgi:hypothetical protein